MSASFKKLVVMVQLVCLVFSSTPVMAAATQDYSAFEALQAADILGVRNELVRFRNIQAGASEEYENEALGLKALLLRKILLGFVQVRQASNKADIELTYTYDILYREQQKLGHILDAMNLFNFTQLGVLYTIAPWSRIYKQFIRSNVLGEISAGVGTGVSVMSIMVGKFYRVNDPRPPKFLENSLDGAPVDAAVLPVYVNKFLDYPDAGETKSRKDAMFEFWKKNYGVDPANRDTLAGIDSKKQRSLGWLNRRIVLLWSLRNQIQKFDKSLLALTNACATTLPVSSSGSSAPGKLGTKASEAARILKIESQVAELLDLNDRQIRNKRRLELETVLLEQVLIGLLEVRIATDKVDQELNYSYDIALASLLAKRGALQQKNFEFNFIQNGTSVAVAKYLFFKEYGKAANEVLLVSGAMSTLCSAAALAMSRGGRRKNSDKPNSLAEFLDLDLGNYHFSPLMTAFLATPSDESKDGKSKKEFLLNLWKNENIGGMRHASNKRQHKLAALPPAKYDTIGICKKRIDLLSSLKINLELLDKDLLALLQETGFDQRWANAQPGDPISESVTAGLNPYAAEAARLLQVRHPITGLYAPGKVQDLDRLADEFSLTRKVMQALVDLRVTADKVEFEIVKETEVRDRLVRARDWGIALTNNANFFQLGILSMIQSGPYALSRKKRYNHYSDKLNVCSGLLVCGFTLGSLLQQPGGVRLSKTEPNMLGQVLGLEVDPDLRLSPLVWKFLNSMSPVAEEGRTRREQLIEFWRKQKSLSRNPDNRASAERLAANGKSHHWWNETIKQINRRLNALYALHGTVDLLERELSDLLLAAE